jgi:phospholipase/carboxylesterase
MSQPLLESVEVATGRVPQASVIWMHGLGADGHDFEPVVPQLGAAVSQPLRFIFPHAPVRPVSFNGGMPMRSWYDIVALDRTSKEDEHGLAESAARVTALIERENERGITDGRIVLAGFSQGGALSLYLGTRYPQRLAGLVVLSSYLPLAGKLAAEASAANRTTPIFMAHGTLDGVIDESMGLESRSLLAAQGYAVEWHTYPMDHAVCEREIADIAAFLQRMLYRP